MTIGSFIALDGSISRRAVWLINLPDMNRYEWIGEGVSRMVAGILIMLLGFGSEVTTIYVRVSQRQKDLDALLKDGKQGLRFSFIPLSVFFLYDLIKGVLPWNPLALTMWVVGSYLGLRWTDSRRKH